VSGAARYPGRIQPGNRTDRMTLTMDIFATACAALGVPVPENIDGVSFWPTLLGQSYEVEYCDDLGAGFWATSGDAIVGTGALLAFTNQLALPDQRFYRLKLLRQ